MLLMLAFCVVIPAYKASEHTFINGESYCDQFILEPVDIDTMIVREKMPKDHHEEQRNIGICYKLRKCITGLQA
uniref:Secreted protein n=1 Tax=Steinernema glaseri TaxID=37863 RepID=A0A1I7ZGY7_9BILA